MRLRSERGPLELAHGGLELRDARLELRLPGRERVDLGAERLVLLLDIARDLAHEAAHERLRIVVHCHLLLLLLRTRLDDGFDRRGQIWRWNWLGEKIWRILEGWW